MKLSLPVALLLALVIVGGAGAAFGGGVLYGRSSAPKATGISSPVGAASATRSAGTPATGGARGSTSAVSGAVDSIAGSTLTVRTQAGTLQTVTISAATRFTMAAPDALSDLHSGDAVQVVGQADGTGTITASTITRQ